MTTFTVPNIPKKLPAEIVLGALDCSNRLRSGETLGGTPTITASSSGLTVGTVTVTTAAATINGSTVSTGQAVTFTLSGGTAGELYSLVFSSTTSAGQTISERMGLRVIE